MLPCHLFQIMAAKGLGRENAVAASVEAVRELAPRFTVSGWANIVNLGDEAQAQQLENLLVPAGLAP